MNETSSTPRIECILITMLSKPLPAQDLTHILTHARESFLALRDARLFITGGTGFFGHWLLESLLHADLELHINLRATVLTRNASAFRDQVSRTSPTHPAITPSRRRHRAPSPFPLLEPPTHILHAATDSGGQQDLAPPPKPSTTTSSTGTQPRARHGPHLRSEHTGSRPPPLHLHRSRVRPLYHPSSTPPETLPAPGTPTSTLTKSAKLAAERLCLHGYADDSASGPTSRSQPCHRPLLRLRRPPPPARCPLRHRQLPRRRS